MSKKIQPSIFADFGVPLFMTGTDVPVNIRELAPEGLNWITLPSQATATQVPPDRTDISVEYQPNSGTQVIGPIQATM